MVKKILSIVLWVATAAGLIVLFIFAREDYLNQPLKAIQIITETDTGFVRKGALRDEIWQLCGKSNIGTVNMIAIQERLNNNPWIEENSSYVDLDGTLHVSFKEYEPKFRVFGKGSRSIYVTNEGIVIPTSPLYTPYVLVASGNFDLLNDSLSYRLNDTLVGDRNIINALHWFKAIEENTFVKNCVGQLYCNGRDQFELTVRGLDARVIVGDTCDAADKLYRLEVFMKQRINSPETRIMKSINLNYKNQIVCTKR